jgi:hypothetical protein
MQPMPPGYGAQGPGYGAPPQPTAPVAGKNPAIGLFVIALVIAVGAFSHSWARTSEDHGDFSMSVGAGLTGGKVSACEEGDCHDASVDWGGESGDQTTNDLKYLGYLAMLGSLAAIALCAAAGGMVLSGNARKINVPTFVALIATGAGTMGIFLIRLLTKDLGGGGDDPTHLSISWSGFLGIGGAIAGAIVIGSVLAPIVRAAQAAPMPMQMPMAQAMPGYPQQQPMQQQPMQQQPMQQQPQMMTACPRCGGQLTYVAQYQRSFCHACQQYA